MGDPFVRPGLDYPPRVEQLVLRYTGTCHEPTQYEWLSHQHRDTLSSIANHYDHLMFASVAENVSTGRMRQMLLDSMLRPCGPPPPEDIEKRKRDPVEEEMDVSALR